MDVTLFGSSVFPDVIKKMRLCCIGVGPKSITTGVLIGLIRRKFGHRDTDTWGEGYGKTGAKTEVMHL